MEEGLFSRMELLLGAEAVATLAQSRVLVFGAGGVGGYVIEALARSGVGSLGIVDGDTVSLSNCNRQILALQSTLGRHKVDVARERVHDINPAAHVDAHDVFFLPGTEGGISFCGYSYVVDAVDTVAAKVHIIARAKEAGIPVISSMGAGNKLDPAQLEVADIRQTSVCPLARAVRRELSRRGITGVKVVYSREPPVRRGSGGDPRVPGSSAFVPPAAGLIIASEVVRDLLRAGAEFRSQNTPPA